MRDLFLRASVALGVFVALSTEILSPFHLLHGGPLIALWLLALAAAAVFLRPKLTRIAFRPLESATALACAAIVGVVAVTAWVSPPNSTDAMAYHLPRVIYWAQAASVAFFPTPYFNQVSLQPLTEYFFLHSYLITGGDRLVNLITCAVFLASILGVSALAGALGAGRRGQAFAALFCATLPNGILQASGAKNDWMLALWLICAAYFALRKNAPLTGLALGLALFTKGTAYLYAPPLLLATLRVRPRALGWIAAGVLLVNTPQYIRNLRLNGSPLGYDSAQGDGFYRWRNEHPGVKSTLSNLIRHTSDQLGDRRERWNEAIFYSALALHRTLGIDPNDPATTWPYTQFSAPINANHEANANNRWHLLLIGIALVTRQRRRLVYAAGLIAAFLLFCFYLKWQPFMGRLELPLFALAAPLAGLFLEWLRPAIIAIAVGIFFVANTRLPLFQNWTRPLQGPHSLFTASRDDNYFRDMTYWNNRAWYLQAVDLTARSHCTTVGIDIAQYQLEYPFQALLLERNPAVRFEHPAPGQPRPCAVLCLDCAGIGRKVELYSPIGPPIEIGRFLLFLQ